MWHSRFTPAWFDCGCGWPGRLARSLGQILPHGNFRVDNAARHASGPSHVLSLLNLPSGFPYRDSHIFLLDFTTYYASMPKARAMQHQIVDEAIMRALLRLPTSPAVITLELPPGSHAWREMFARNGSADCIEQQSYVTRAVSPLVAHYGTTMLSAIPVVAAALRGDDGARLAQAFCLKYAFGMTPHNEVHPNSCLHTLVAEMIASHLVSLLRRRHGPRSALRRHQGSDTQQYAPDMPSTSARAAAANETGRTLYLHKCSDPSVRSVAQACAQLNIASDALFFTDAGQIKRRSPLQGATCARPPPVSIGFGEYVPKPWHTAVRHGAYHAPESCVATGAAPSKSWDAMGLSCWGWANSTCTPIGSPHWVATYEAHNDFAWYTCGPTAHNGNLAHPLTYAMKCNVPGFLFVTYLQSYTANWGMVDVVVESQASPPPRAVIAHGTVDSRSQDTRRSLVETASIRILPQGEVGGGQAPQRQEVRVSLTPLVRGSRLPEQEERTGRRRNGPGQRWPLPKQATDQACSGKFKLISLACH